MICPARPLRFDPPTDDSRWWALSDRQRRHAAHLLKTLEAFARARTIEEGADVAVAYCDGRWSRKRLKDLWREFRQREGDWQLLVPKQNNGHALPVAFLMDWKSRCERHQRKNYPAWKELIADWAAWRRGDDSRAVSGYTYPPAPQKGKAYPLGWSYKNLARHAPEEYELTAARQGRGKVKAKYLPKVLTTRADLLPGQYYLFDDVWHDLTVNVLGQQTSVRPIELGVMDLFSGLRPLWLMKPILTRDDGTRSQLLEDEALYLTAALLRQCGYRPEGTVLVMEHGTATIRGKEFEEQLAELTGGAVKIEKGGIQGAAAMAGQYAARGKGNPRFKAALESWHNLMHNRMDQLPGQVGRHPANEPEENYRLQLRNNHLLKALHALAEAGQLEQIRGLRFDLLEYHQFTRLAGMIYDRIHDDPSHNLEGWQEAGLIAHEWRLSSDHDFASLDEIPEGKLDLVRQICFDQDGLHRTRKLSRREAWRSRASGLRKLSAPAMAALLVDKVGKERTVNDEGCFVFQDNRYNSGEYHFLARVHGMNGDHETPLTRREKYTTVWNPLMPDELHVLDAKGKYLGICPAWNRPSRADQSEVFRNIGRVREIEGEMLRPLSFRGKSLMEKRRQDAEANIRLLDPQEAERLESRERSRKMARTGGELRELEETEDHSTTAEEYSLSDIEE